MSYAIPVTRATGYVVLATDWNTEHVANFVYLDGYTKNTSKQVANTVTETDLLNGEITIAAGILGTTGSIRLTACGDWHQASLGDKVGPRFKLKLGATVLLDTNTCVSTFSASSAARGPWRIVCEIANLNVANSQWATMTGVVFPGLASGDAAGNGVFAVGTGTYTVTLTPTSGAVARIDGGSAAAAAVDTTLAQVLALTVINPSAASTDTTLNYAKVELLP